MAAKGATAKAEEKQVVDASNPAENGNPEQPAADANVKATVGVDPAAVAEQLAIDKKTVKAKGRYTVARGQSVSTRDGIKGPTESLDDCGLDSKQLGRLMEKGVVVDNG